MNSRVFSVFLLFYSFLSFAQNEDFEKGVQLFKDSAYSEALSSFQAAQKIERSIKNEFYMASCHMFLEQFETAKNEFIQIVNEHDSKNIEVQWSMINGASCYRELKMIDSSIYYYQSACELYPKSGAHYNLAQLYYQLDKFELAKDCYTRAIEADPKDVMNYLKRQEIEFILEDFEGAHNDMLKVKEIDPESYNPNNEAFCFTMMKKYNKADSIYLSIYDETNPFFLNNFGFNKHKMGASDQGIELINKSLAMDPKNAFAYRNLGVIYNDLQKTKKACKCWEKALDLNFSTQYGNEVQNLMNQHCKN